MWLDCYVWQEFIRFAIIHKADNRAVGTIEMFGKVGAYETIRGILRVDIASEYETKECLFELFSLCVKEFFLLFSVRQIVAKAILSAEKRIKALTELGFKAYIFQEREHYWGIQWTEG